MKKFLLSVAFLGLMASPAFAQEEGGQGPAGPGGRGGEMMKEHHAKMDTDGDGNISKAEFLAVQEQRFNELDANSNGIIEKEEFQAFREKMKGKAGEWREKMKERRGQRQAPGGEAPVE